MKEGLAVVNLICLVIFAFSSAFCSSLDIPPLSSISQIIPGIDRLGAGTNFTCQTTAMHKAFWAGILPATILTMPLLTKRLTFSRQATNIYSALKVLSIISGILLFLYYGMEIPRAGVFARSFRESALLNFTMNYTFLTTPVCLILLLYSGVMMNRR